MQELKTTASLVDYEALDASITAVLARRELEEALAADEPAQLWLELGQEGFDDSWLLAVDLGSEQVEELLGRSPGDEVTLALDEEGLVGLLGDAEVEAHGIRGALAIAVAGAAIAAPAGLAATPQTAGTAATLQQAKAAATGAAATAHVSKVAATAQVSKFATKAQISRSLVVKATGISSLRSRAGR